MPAVPLGLKAYRRDAAFQPEARLVNLLIEKDESGASLDGIMRITRPGLVTANQLGGDIRGIYREDGVAQGWWYVVHGNALSRIVPDGGATQIASIGGTTPVQMVGTTATLFVLANGALTAWTEPGPMQAIAIPEGYAPVAIEAINGYLIVECSSGRFYWLEPGEFVIDALNFATAESAADGLVGVTRLVDELFFGGRTSIEPWQPSGVADAPFQKAAGRQFERGLLARDTLRRFDNSLLWVGDDCIVYRVGSVPERISGHGIEERLRKRSADPSAWTFSTDGHKLYVLAIPGQGTFAYDASSGEWSEFAETGGPWFGAIGHESGGIALAGNELGKVWKIDPEARLDNGAAFPQIITGTVPSVGRPQRNGSLAIDLGASAPCAVKVRWRDGREDYPAFAEELETDGAEIVNLYRLGAIRQPSRTYEIRVDDPVGLRISGALANEAWQ